jgi:predicted RNA-binding Zn-ribbon protein involved in translation (DUF1610 family)
MSLSQFCCPDCGHTIAFYSRRRNAFEKYLLPLAGFRPFRCANCFRRSYWLYSTPGKEPKFRHAVVSTTVSDRVPAVEPRVA